MVSASEERVDPELPSRPASFTGPVKKQDGSDWLAAGQVSDDGTLLGMNFYVAGVDDKLPQ